MSGLFGGGSGGGLEEEVFGGGGGRGLKSLGMRGGGLGIGGKNVFIAPPGRSSIELIKLSIVSTLYSSKSVAVYVCRFGCCIET